MIGYITYAYMCVISDQYLNHIIINGSKTTICYYCLPPKIIFNFKSLCNNEPAYFTMNIVYNIVVMFVVI